MAKGTKAHWESHAEVDSAEARLLVEPIAAAKVCCEEAKQAFELAKMEFRAKNDDAKESRYNIGQSALQIDQDRAEIKRLSSVLV